MIDIILKVVFPVKFLFLNRNKTDSIYTTKSEDKNSIPWDELTKKGKETKETKESQDVQNIIAKQREHIKEEYIKLEEQKNMHNFSSTMGRFRFTANNEIEKSPQTKVPSSPSNFKTKIKGDYNDFLESYNKFSNKK